MMNFRYHVVSLIAVLFALSIGLVLGAGLLSSGTGTAAAVSVVDLQAETALLRERVASAEATLEFSDGVGEATQADQVGATLTDRRVVVVALPGADPAAVSGTREALGASGATVTGTIEVAEAWTDAASDAVLDSLAAQLVASGATLPDTDGYERGAVVLASALLDAAPTRNDDTATATATAFAESDLLTLPEPVRGTAELAVVVAGDPVADDGEAGRRLGALTSLAAAFDTEGAGAVLAGPPPSAADGGVVQAVRADADLAAVLSTVDMVQLSSGRTSAVLALAEQQAGGVGHYGAVGEVDGALPAQP
ncbi:MAG: copper transporter [Jiangellales bacterium]